MNLNLFPAPPVSSSPQLQAPPSHPPVQQGNQAQFLSTPMIRLTNFTGKEEEFQGWARKFEIRANLMGYHDLLTGSKIVDPSDVQDKNMQLYGYNDLLMACSDPVSYTIVSRAHTKVFKLGCIKTAWENLNARFNPSNGASMIRLHKRFMNMALSPDQDPALWLSEAEELKAQVDPAMSDDKFLIHLMTQLPHPMMTQHISWR